MNKTAIVGSPLKRTKSCSELDTSTPTKIESKKESLKESVRSVEVKSALDVEKHKTERLIVERDLLCENLRLREEELASLKEKIESAAELGEMIKETFEIYSEAELDDFVEYYNNLINVEAKHEKLEKDHEKLNTEFTGLVEIDEKKKRELSDEVFVHLRKAKALEEEVKVKTEEIDSIKSEMAAMKTRNGDYARVLGPVAIGYLFYSNAEVVGEGVKLCLREMSNVMAVEGSYAMAGIAVAGVILYAASSKIVPGILNVASAVLNLLVNALNKAWEYKNAVMLMGIMVTIGHYNETANSVLASIKLELPLYYRDFVDEVSDRVARYYA